MTNATTTARTYAEITLFTTRSPNHTDDFKTPATFDCVFDTTNKSVAETLDNVFASQGNNPEGSKMSPYMRSLSVGDIIKIDAEYYAVGSGCSFMKINSGIYFAWCALESKDREWLIRDIEECKVVQG